MKKIIWISTICLQIFILGACTQKIDHKVIPPEDLIPRDEMVDIIVDLHLYDAIMTGARKRGFKDKKLNDYYIHNSVMEKYKLSRERFEESFNYYQSDLKVIDDIYADVITKLSKMKRDETGE